MDPVKITIDGKEVTTAKGKTVIQVADELGVAIPRYCYHPKLSIAGNCRMCLVEIEKMPKLQIACNTQVAEGMSVLTQSPKVLAVRKAVLEFLLINHPLDCPICDQAGECKLQEYSVDYGKSESRFVEAKVHKPKRVDLGPRIVLDDERCILCTRCIRFTKDVVGDDALGIISRGSFNTLTAYPGSQVITSPVVETKLAEHPFDSLTAPSRTRSSRSRCASSPTGRGR